jgi:hypothetical protein
LYKTGPTTSPKQRVLSNAASQKTGQGTANTVFGVELVQHKSDKASFPSIVFVKLSCQTADFTFLENAP